VRVFNINRGQFIQVNVALKTEQTSAIAQCAMLASAAAALPCSFVVNLAALYDSSPRKQALAIG
jgi:hypothetical protein